MTSQQSNNSRPEQSAPENSSLSPMEAMVQRLDAHFNISGPTDEETEESDGQEYKVTFPPNRMSGQPPSSKPSPTSASSSAQPDPMRPAIDGIEEWHRQQNLKYAQATAQPNTKFK